MNTDFFGTIDRTSYFSNLNAGVKLIVSFTLIIAALIVRDPLTSGILFALELLGFILVRFRPVNVLARFWPIPHRRHHHRLVRRHAQRQKRHHHSRPRLHSSITTDSAAVGAAMMIRSLAMVLPTLAFVLTTDPTDLVTPRTNLQTALPVPCSQPSLPCAWSVFSSLSGTPSARHDAPAGLGAGQSLIGRAQTFGGQSFALLVQAIRRGSRLAITMEARGFGAGERTWARVPSYSPRDVP